MTNKIYKIRVIIDFELTKLYNQYNQIKNLLPLHTLYYYKRTDKIQDDIEYNLFFDCISENALKLCPSKYNILLVNEEYIHNKYLRREDYLDQPLIFIKDIVDYYFCLTLYSKNILLNDYKINKNKIIFLDRMVSDIYSINKINKRKYILYDIDEYSAQDNLIFLDTWVKNYIDRPENLIIIYKYMKDIIFKYIFNLISPNEQYTDGVSHFSFFAKIHNIYKNIIVTSDKNIINEIENDILAVIINTSYYNFITSFNENILKERLIITNNNNVKHFKKIKYFIPKTNKTDDIIKCFDKLFKLSPKNITDITKKNKQILLSNNISLKKKLINFFKVSENTNHKYPMIPFPKEKPDEENYEIVRVNIIKKHEEIKSDMDKIELKFKTKNNNDIFNQYYRILKEPSKLTDCAYLTIVIINNKYLPSILVSGYILKYVAKTKYNIVCLVQDKPYYVDGNIISPGLNKDEINDIKKIYDCVVGIDLLNIDLKEKRVGMLPSHYSNIKYYVTKVLVTGFIKYKKIFYYDSTTMIQKNIDYYMKVFNNNKYYTVYNDNLHRGMVGNLCLIIPKTYYLNKMMYLIKNYNKYFGNNFYFTPDEDVFYYTCYPNWDKIQINSKTIKYNAIRNPYINSYNQNINNNYCFNTYVILKPFICIINNNMFQQNHTCYKIWDDNAENIMIKYPELSKYFRFINTYRIFGKSS